MAYGSKQVSAIRNLGLIYQGLYGPAAVGQGANTIFGMLAQSPIATSQLANIGAASGGAYARTARGLARRGMTGTGVGTLGTALSRSVGTSMTSDFYAQLYAQALQASLTNVGQMAQGTSYSSQGVRWDDPHWQSKQLGALFTGAGALVGAL